MSLEPWTWGPRVAGLYTVAAFALALAVGRRSLDRRGHAAAWMLVLTVAGLRSPMAPGYLIAGVHLAMILVGAELRTRAGWAAWGALVAATVVTMPAFAASPMWVALAGQAVMHGIILWLLLRRWPVLDASLPAAPLGGDMARGG